MKPKIILQYLEGTTDIIVTENRWLMPIIARALLRSLVHYDVTKVQKENNSDLVYMQAFLGGKGDSYKVDREKTLAEPNERMLISTNGTKHIFEDCADCGKFIEGEPIYWMGTSARCQACHDKRMA